MKKGLLRKRGGRSGNNLIFSRKKNKARFLLG